MLRGCPTGTHLLARDNHLLAISSNGVQRKLASLPEDVFIYWLRWSPDGKTLRFTTNGSVSTAMWEVAADGSNLHQLLPGWREPTQGNWTPDGKYFVFSAVRNNRADLWAMREKGDLMYKVSHEPVRLTAGPLNMEAPQPTPDGKKILAVGSQQRAEVVRYDTKAAQFLPYLNGVSAMGGANFSRDAQWLSYITWPQGELWRCRVDGSEKLQLTTAPLLVESAGRSPDGSQIAFAGELPGEKAHIFLVAASTGASRQVAGENLSLHRPSWTPDGNSLLLVEAGEGPEICLYPLSRFEDDEDDNRGRFSGTSGRDNFPRTDITSLPPRWMGKSCCCLRSRPRNGRIWQRPV